MQLDERTSSKIRNMGLICTALIVLYHLPVADECGDIFVCGLRILKRVVCPVAVPIFFAISGFLIARTFKGKDWYKNQVGRRVWSLLIPYFAINTIYLPLIIVYHNILGLGEWPGGKVGFDLYSLGRIYGLNPNFNPACGAFWFVRTLFIFTLISPFAAYIAKRERWISLVVVSGLLILARFVEIYDWYCDFLYGFFNIRGLGFYILGMNFYLHDWRLENRTMAIAGGGGIDLRAFGVLSAIQWYGFPFGKFSVVASGGYADIYRNTCGARS